jgi:hypothetical protein
MAHHMNLVLQILFVIHVVKCIESFLQRLHAYFAHSPNRHLEFTKLAKVMEATGNKSFAMWRFNGFPCWVMQKETWQSTKFDCWKWLWIIVQTSKHLCDLQIVFELACILPLLKFVHVLIKFAHMQNIFVCDLVVVIKVYQGDLYNMYCDQISKFDVDSF